ncbi:hypothetical protein N7501_000012 [Penicillium viridicatum]|nr:hypothetical protein N7501_000012 [Penicillium viridicatum]
MATTSPNRASVFEKAILVYTPDFDVSCFAVLRIGHDKKANQGSISLKITADLANLSGKSPLTLNLSPGVVKECTLARKSNDRLCPPVPWSMSPNNKTRKRQLLTSPEALDSLTEANTPSTRSTRSLSPSSIRPTDFTLTFPPSHIKRNKLTHLVYALRGVSDKEVHKVLIQSERGHLLAIPDSDLPSESEKVRFANVEIIERRLEQYVNDEIERRLKRYVNDEIVDRAAEDGKAEVCNAANDYMKDLEEEIQKHKDKIEEQTQQCLNEIEDRAIEVEMSAQEEIAKLKRWFNVSAQTLLDRKSSTSHELDTRRISI